MAGTMSQADLVVDLKASLMDSSNKFKLGDQDLSRLIDIAALDMSRVRPRILAGSVTLTAGQDSYAAPSDVVSVHSLIWGRDIKRSQSPWNPQWVGALPRISVAGDSSSRQLLFSPSPTQRQINVLGASCRYRYGASHSVGVLAVDTSIQGSDRHLLLLRAAAEAMRELAQDSVSKSMKMGAGLLSAPRNGTPAALYTMLMREFELQS